MTRGVIVYIHIFKDSPIAGNKDGSLVSERIETTLVNAASVGDNSIIITSVANYYVGLSIIIGGIENRVISAINPTTHALTLTTQLTNTHIAGAKVVNTDNRLSPITPPNALSATTSDVSAGITLAIRTVDVLELVSEVLTNVSRTTVGNTVLTIIGSNSDKWSLSLDGSEWAEWGAPLTITTSITNVNTLFYIRAKAVNTEAIMNDVSVDIQISCTVITE